MRQLLLFCLLAAISIHLPAQFSLSNSYHLFRQGDRLVKQQVTYQAPGQSGIHILWDFSKQELIDNHYELKYSSLGSSLDSIVGTERRTRCYYHTQGDSLFSLGYENPTTFIKYRKPELLLTFPFPYGRTLTDYFEGQGHYCNRLAIYLQGKSSVTADANGQIVLPGGDTLQHVMRVYTYKKITEQTRSLSQHHALQADTLSLSRDSIDYHLNNDSLHLEIETWRWYAAGYRYPVFETIKSTTYKYNHPYQQVGTSFYYPPHEQYYDLPNDPENQEKRNMIDEQEIRSWQEASGEGMIGNEDKKISYSYRMNDQNNLQLNYSLFEEAKVTLSLYDMQGRQLSATKEVFESVGSYQKEISLSCYSKGEYLLQITVDKKRYGLKITTR